MSTQSPLPGLRPLNDHFMGIVDNLLERQLSNRSEQDAQMQTLLQILPMSGFLILLFFSVFGWHNLKDPYTTAVKLVSSFAFLVVHINLRRLKPLQLGYIICAIFTLFSFAYLTSEKHGAYILDWTIFVPIACMVMLGRHRGLVWSLIYIALIFLYGLYNVHTDGQSWWDITRLASYTFSMLLLSVVSYLTNFFFEHSQNKLRALSATDPMTGLFNRRHIDNFLRLELKSALENDTPLSLAMVDADDFKDINDTWGHLEGDKSLKTIADVLQKSLRGSDIVGRWGGEEFIVLLPHTNLETARLCMERVRQRIETTSFDHNVPITVSVGLSCTANGAPKDADKLTECADRALYDAKRSGKNRIVATTCMS